MSESAQVEHLPCQIDSIPKIGQAVPAHDLAPIPLSRRLILFLKRKLSPKTKRNLKFKTNTAFFRLFPKATLAAEPKKVAVTNASFVGGDWVRIRSKEEVIATLNYWKELKGCGFLPEMEQYCGSIQQVLKPVQRFIDERDYKVKKTQGIYLLKGLICQGRDVFGSCDRSCFYFWREEWLERVDTAEPERGTYGTFNP